MTLDIQPDQLNIWINIHGRRRSLPLPILYVRQLSAWSPNADKGSCAMCMEPMATGNWQ